MYLSLKLLLHLCIIFNLDLEVLYGPPHLGVSRTFEAQRGVRGWRPPGADPETLPVRQIPY